MHCDSVALPDGPVNLYRTGDGPPVVLLHGLLGSPAYLLPLARALANERQVLVPELPGHGASAAVRPFTFARAADQLAAAVAAFTDQPPAVLGHSLGAPLAVTWAARHEVRSLVAVSPVGMLPLRLGPVRHAVRVAPAVAAVVELAAPVLHSTRAGRRFAFGWFVGMARPDAVCPELARRLVLESAHAGATPALPEMLEQLLECDLRPAAEAVRCPVLVAWGERDAHPGNGPALASALRADTLIIPGVGHMPMLEAPFAFRRALRGWL